MLHGQLNIVWVKAQNFRNSLHLDSRINAEGLVAEVTGLLKNIRFLASLSPTELPIVFHKYLLHMYFIFVEFVNGNGVLNMDPLMHEYYYFGPLLAYCSAAAVVDVDRLCTSMTL